MRQFIIEPYAGLANRLRVLLSAQRLAEMTNRALAVVWLPHKGCGCQYSDLFENEIQQVDSGDLSDVASSEIVRISKNDTHHLFSEAPVVYCRSCHILGKPGEFPYGVFTKLAPYFNRLKPIRWIQEAVDACVANRFRSHMLGVHVRRGDRVDKKIREQGLIGTVSDLFFKEVDRYLRDWPEAAIFLATDDGAPTERFEKYTYRPEGLVREFTERYGTKLVIYKKRTLDRADVTGVQDALIDLLLLNNTNFVFGSAGSSFSQFAIMRNLESRKTMRRCLRMVGGRINIPRIRPLAARMAARIRNFSLRWRPRRTWR